MSYQRTLWKDRTSYSAPQAGCIWTKVFLAWKVFLVLAWVNCGWKLHFTIENGKFRCRFCSTKWYFPMPLEDSDGMSIPLHGNFRWKYHKNLQRAGLEPSFFALPILYPTSRLWMLSLKTLKSLFKRQNIKRNVKLICVLYFSLNFCKQVELNFFVVVIIQHDGIPQLGTYFCLKDWIQKIIF